MSGVWTDRFVRADIQKTRVQKIGLGAQNLLSILDSQADLYDQLVFKRIIALTKNKKIRKKRATGVIWTYVALMCISCPTISGCRSKSLSNISN